MEVIVIRDATASDMPRLKAIFRASSLSNADDRPILLAHPEVLELADRAVVEGRTRVAAISLDVVGFATFADSDDGLEVEDLFVDPDWMRHGVGTALVEDLVDIGGRRGERRLVVTGNLHAQEFYEAVGFVADGPAETELGSGLRMHLDL